MDTDLSTSTAVVYKLESIRDGASFAQMNWWHWSNYGPV